MPAEQGQGGKKLAVIIGGALSFGVAIGVLCIVGTVSGPGSNASRVAHKERSTFLHHGQGETLIVDTSTPAPKKSAHKEELEHREQQRARIEKEQSHNESTEHNSTEQNLTGHNETKKNETEHDDHKHTHCHGGPEAACECMLTCKVFGSDSSRCMSHRHNHTETRRIVDDLIAQTMMSHKSMCDGMRCVKECAKFLGCLDRKVMEDCRIVKKNYDDNKLESDPDCDLSCDK